MGSKRWYQKKSVKFAVPFLLFMVGGSIGLREFTQLRYKYRTIETYNPRDEAKKHGIKVTDPEKLTLEAQYEELKKENLDQWENVRIPRPKNFEN